MCVRTRCYCSKLHADTSGELATPPAGCRVYCSTIVFFHTEKACTSARVEPGLAPSGKLGVWFLYFSELLMWFSVTELRLATLDGLNTEKRRRFRCAESTGVTMQLWRTE